MRTFKHFISEGRPSQRHPLEGHEYHKKTNAELEYIAKDAHAAAEAMKGHNTKAENKYRDQANDSATVRYWRQKNGTPDWYKKKYGHMREEVEQIDEIGDPAEMYRKATETAKAKLQTMRALDRTREYEKKRIQNAKLKTQKEEVEIDEDWQKVNKSDRTDGLSQKAVNAYRRENPGSKLQTAVTEKNPKGKRASRRKSFCSRMSGMKKRLTNPENARDPDSPINKALRRWNC
jgi:hypothetical protein